MSTLAWTRFGYLTRPFRLLRAIISGTATFIEEQRAFLSPYATLERCACKLGYLFKQYHRRDGAKSNPLPREVPAKILLILSLNSIGVLCPILSHLVPFEFGPVEWSGSASTTSSCALCIENSRFTSVIGQVPGYTSIC